MTSNVIKLGRGGTENAQAMLITLAQTIKPTTRVLVFHIDEDECISMVEANTRRSDLAWMGAEALALATAGPNLA